MTHRMAADRTDGENLKVAKLPAKSPFPICSKPHGLRVVLSIKGC